MKLAISSIAWHPHEEAAVAALMQELGVTGVEVAPTKIWASPLSASAAEVDRYRRFWASHGIGIVAMQALLFGRADLTIFDDASTRQATLDYLKGMIDLAAGLGAQALVFGSPKNRQVGALPPAAVAPIAEDFFRTLGEHAFSRGCCLCIEPNPVAYACDFVTAASEGIALVQAANQAGFGLHLDAAGMHMAGDAFDASIDAAMPVLRHFHISEPWLGQIGAGGVDHAACIAALRRNAYAHWISIEMKTQHDEACVASVRDALIRVQHLLYSGD